MKFTEPRSSTYGLTTLVEETRLIPELMTALNTGMERGNKAKEGAPNTALTQWFLC